jgi:transcriptional regulator with XRE-family HTH domain
MKGEKQKERSDEAVLIGEQIRVHRVMRRLSQKALAQQIDVSRGWVGKVERGIHLPNLPLLFKISKALKVHARDLIPPH